MSMLTSTKFPYQMTPAELAREVEARLELAGKIRYWRDCAVADGWTVAATYADEPADRAFTMTAPNGFLAMGMLRLDAFPAVSLHLYDRDGGISLDEALTFPYDMPALIAGTRTCPACGAKDVDTVRIAFANRACASCAPALRKQYETPGWAD